VRGPEEVQRLAAALRRAATAVREQREAAQAERDHLATLIDEHDWGTNASEQNFNVSVDGTTVKVDMTLTSPACPSGPELMTNAENEIKSLPGVEKVEVNLVWAPFWTPEKMEPRVRAYLGF